VKLLILAGDELMYLFLSIVILLSFIFILRLLLVERLMLRKLAYLDKLTGVSNRNALDRYWANYAGKGKLAILFLDLDHFKDVNDRLGHHAGDLLLREVGLCLQQLTGHNKSVFRIGGDEFIVIMSDTNVVKAEHLASQILDELEKPFIIQGRKLTISGSVGISISSEGTNKNCDILLKQADIAMYQAKRSGKGCYSVYSEEQYSYYNESELLFAQKASAN
jgi:diguanylate cyclase